MYLGGSYVKSHVPSPKSASDSAFVGSLSLIQFAHPAGPLSPAISFISGFSRSLIPEIVVWKSLCKRVTSSKAMASTSV